MNEKNKIVVDVHKCAQCLLCQLICSFTYTESFNISKSKINIDIARRTISFSEGCNNCGICTHYCAYGALIIENQKEENRS
jgi:Fe-S-cluster-containing hydrogenase component 2